MRGSLLTRVGSLAAAAAIATTGAMATAGMAGATTPSRLHTSLSARTIPATLHHHHVTVILGHLSSHKSPLRGEVVYLDRKSGIFLIQVSHEVTDKIGDVVFIVAPKKATEYVLVFKGTKNFAPSHSKFVTARP
jgi:hypothetical protein